MHTTRIESASDSRANSATCFDDEPVSAGGVAVYVLYVQPDGMDGFVLDVYGSRARAAVDAAVLRDGETAVSVREYRVDAPQVAGWVPAGGER
jgi:hypothetical protein